MKAQKYACTMTVVIGLSAAAAVAADQSTRTTRNRSFTAQTSTNSNSDRELGQLERWSKLKGREIIGTDNQKLGKIEDAVVDLSSGHILYAIAGSGEIGP